MSVAEKTNGFLILLGTILRTLPQNDRFPTGFMRYSELEINFVQNVVFPMVSHALQELENSGVFYWKPNGFYTFDTFAFLFLALQSTSGQQKGLFNRKKLPFSVFLIFSFWLCDPPLGSKKGWLIRRNCHFLLFAFLFLA